MATADLLRATVRCGSAPVPQTKQKEPLDAVLLCSKLDAYLRELEAAQLRKEKRDAVRNGQYIPRLAAKTFAARTSTFMDNAVVTLSTGRVSEPTPVDEMPLEVEERVYIAPVQQCAALNFQWPAFGPESLCHKRRTMTERPDAAIAPDQIAFLAESSVPGSTKALRYEDVAAFERPSNTFQIRALGCESRDPLNEPLEDSKHDSMSPTSSESVALASPSRRQSLSKQVSAGKTSVTTIASPERAFGQYRPGDAAKRRSNDLQRPTKKDIFRSLGQRRASRDDAYLGDSTRDEGLHGAQSHKQRPSLVPHDRPDWAQQSQAGDTHLSLRLLSRTTKKKADMASSLPRPKSALETGDTKAPLAEARTNSMPAEGHLIADAVKKIKREEKMERRKSIFRLTGLFKRS